jgi:hypothetical protein
MSVAIEPPTTQIHQGMYESHVGRLCVDTVSTLSVEIVLLGRV